MLKAGHWIYDDLELLSSETKTTMILETQPVAIGEIRYFLDKIDYEKLSQSGKVVYKRVQDYLGKENNLVNSDDFTFYFNLIAAPELYYKSNKDIDWSFVFNYKNNFLTMPVIIGFSDYFTFHTDFYFGKNAYYSTVPENFTNFPVKPKEINFYFPDYSYFSFNRTFNKWGISAHMGRKGLKIGNTSMGSIIYNDTFETDFYTQLNLYGDYLKYSMDVSQIDNTKYFYIHQLTFRPFKNFNVGILEGSLINAPFELRFLNPFTVMHNFGGWKQYDKEQKEIYGESNFCAYFGLSVEYIPIKNLRLYGLYAQNEMFDPGASRTPGNLSMPDSIGVQIGGEYTIPLENEGHIVTGLEALYTSPFLYIKQSPDWSLFRNRYDMHSHTDYKSWLGSPTGPDSFVVQAKVDYKSNKNWSASAKYKFSIHGENTFENLFNEKNKMPVLDEEGNPTGKWYWSYYPNVIYRNNKDNDEIVDKAVKTSRNMWMSGTAEYKNEIILDGNYRINDHIDLAGQFIYAFVFNSKNISDNFDHGVELALSASFNLF